MCVAINAMPDNMVQTNNIMTIFFSFVSNEYRQKEHENESSFGLKGFIISFFSGTAHLTSARIKTANIH